MSPSPCCRGEVSEFRTAGVATTNPLGSDAEIPNRKLYGFAAHPARTERTATQQGSLFRNTQPEWVEVAVQRVHLERTREFGGPWLGWSCCADWDWIAFSMRRCPRGAKRFPGC